MIVEVMAPGKVNRFDVRRVENWEDLPPQGEPFGMRFRETGVPDSDEEYIVRVAAMEAAKDCGLQFVVNGVRSYSIFYHQ